VDFLVRLPEQTPIEIPFSDPRRAGSQWNATHKCPGFVASRSPTRSPLADCGNAIRHGLRYLAAGL
jgi:hypothetical protein